MQNCRLKNGSSDKHVQKMTSAAVIADIVAATEAPQPRQVG
jgi:hypothetical protein